MDFIKGLPRVTRTLLYINLVVFAICLIGHLFGFGVMDTLAMYPFNSSNFHFWQPLTHMFTHAGLMHILFNMLGLIFLGPDIEEYLGSKNFTLFYLLSGIGAMSLHLLISSSAIGMVGASGAVYGVMAMYAYMFPNRELYIYGILPVKAKWLIGILFLLELYSGFSSPGDSVAHFAHVGGAIVGISLVYTYRNRIFKWL